MSRQGMQQVAKRVTNCNFHDAENRRGLLELLVIPHPGAHLAIVVLDMIDRSDGNGDPALLAIQVFFLGHGYSVEVD